MNTKTAQIQIYFSQHKYQQSYTIQTTSLKLLPSGKCYLCSLNYGWTDQAAQCAKLWSLNKAVDNIIYIESF